MSKRGRPPLPPERRRAVRITVAVTADVSDALFLYAQRKREPISVALGRLLERLAHREQELTVSQNIVIGWPLAR